MNIEKYIKLENDISEGKLIAVLKRIKQLKVFKEKQNDIILLLGRLEKLNSQKKEGTILHNEGNVERNKIRVALLEIVKNIKREFISEDEENYYSLQEEISLIISETNELYISILDRGEKGYNWISGLKQDLDDIKKKWVNQNFTVTIVALMKSGKSTLLNAWMGNEYLSANLKPETMRVVRILYDDKSAKGRLLSKGRSISEGVEEIRSRLSKLNKKAREKDEIPEEEELQLKVSLPALKDKNFKGVNFELLDTPGVNEAGVSSLESKINRLVESSDVIIYLLDVSKLKSEDEEKMFRKLKNERNDLFEEVKTKLFFVINKIDEIENRNFGEAKGFNSEKDVKKYVIDYLEKDVSISLEEDELFLVSAEKAVLGRVMLSGEATEKQRKDFLRRAYGSKMRREPPEEEIIADSQDFIEESGIMNLEEKILNKIHSKRINIFVTSILFKIERLLDQVKRNVEVSKGSLEKKVIQIETLKKDIKRIQRKLSELTEITSDFKKKGNKSVEYYFKKFKTDIIENIKDTFSGEYEAKRDNFLPNKIAELLEITNFSIKTNSKKEIKDKVEERAQLGFVPIKHKK